jgi:4-amino-4-deoxy-L-arabinose transferase-like glycosyltransferase
VVALGAAIVPAVMLIVFWRGAALDDLYQATIVYNLQYSGETYVSRWDMIRYLFVAPIRHAQVDPLWFVGGAGCVFMLMVCVRALAQRRLVTGWIPVVWVALACMSIAINGSRDLPQYFLQAAPALALAAGMAAAIALPRLPARGRWVVVLLIAVATWRVGADPFPKLAGNVWHDTLYALGRIDRRTHLAKYGARATWINTRRWTTGSRRFSCVAHGADRHRIRLRLLVRRLRLR